jgi:hypothetical protein
MPRPRKETKLAEWLVKESEKARGAIPPASAAERAGVCSRVTAWKQYKEWVGAGILSRPWGSDHHARGPQWDRFVEQSVNNQKRAGKPMLTAEVVEGIGRGLIGDLTLSKDSEEG